MNSLMAYPRFRGRKKVFSSSLALIAALAVWLAAPVFGKETTVTPETDLTEVTTQAQSGDVIVLGPGQFKGQIVAKDKALTIKGDPEGNSIIVGSEVQMLAYVEGQSKLSMKNITFRVGDKTELAIYARGGAVELENCTIENTPKEGINLSRARLAMKKCVIRNIGSDGILLLNGSSAKLEAVEFSAIKGNGVVVQDKGVIELRASQFKDIGGIGVGGIKECIVKATKCTFNKVKKHAVHVEQESSATIKECTFSEIESNAVGGFSGSIVQVEGSSFENINASAVAVSDAKLVQVSQCSFKQMSQIVMALGATSEVTVKKNLFSNANGESPAIWIESDAKIDIADNVMHKAASGIAVKSKLSKPAQISGNVLIGTKQTAIYLSLRKTWLLRLNVMQLTERSRNQQCCRMREPCECRLRYVSRSLTVCSL